MAMLKHIEASIKTFNKGTVKTAQKMCTKCGKVLIGTNDCPDCNKSKDIK